MIFTIYDNSLACVPDRHQEGEKFAHLSSFVMGWNTGYNLRNYGYPFPGKFHDSWNYGPHFHSICGIMAKKFFRVYAIMGTNLSAKWHALVK